MPEPVEIAADPMTHCCLADTWIALPDKVTDTLKIIVAGGIQPAVNDLPYLPRMIMFIRNEE